MTSVKIRVPATSANLGPGFDCFGCAFSLYNELTFTKTDSGLTFENVDPQYATPDNLAVTAYRHAQAALPSVAQKSDGLHLRIDTHIPVCRGLGSSASLTVAGIMAAGLLAGHPFSQSDILSLATQVEGHPDNVAPAIYGGMTAAMLSEGTPIAVSFSVSPSIRFLALIPDFELSTKEARRVLPEKVPHADAVFNVAHAAFLPRAMETGDPTLLFHALLDKLHQPYRIPLIPDYPALKALAMNAGANAFFLSGAGPVCMAIATNDTVGEKLKQALTYPASGLHSHWELQSLSVDPQGATNIG